MIKIRPLTMFGLAFLAGAGWVLGTFAAKFATIFWMALIISQAPKPGIDF